MKVKNITLLIIKFTILVPFGLCAAFLLLIGKLFGFTYKEISVIFNLWIQGAVLMISGLLPSIAQLIVLINSPSVVNGVFLLCYLIYASIYIVGFIALLKHYNIPYNDAFDLCVNDLVWIASKWHISYHAVNLVIFVLWWLSVVILNIYFSYLIINQPYFH